MNSFSLPPEVVMEIQKCLDRGNTVELKLVRGEIQVIEISRKLKIKTIATGR